MSTCSGAFIGLRRTMCRLVCAGALISSTLAATSGVASARTNRASRQSSLTARVTRVVSRGYGREIHARARLSGFRVIRIHVACAETDAHPYRFDCYAKTTFEHDKAYDEYGIYIVATRAGWHTIGSSGILLRSW